MSDNSIKGTYFTLTKPAAVIWQDLFKPRKFDAKAKPKFGAVYLLPKDHPDLPALNTLVVGLVRAFAPIAGRDLPGLTLPLKDGDKLAAAGKGEFLRGHVLFRAGTADDTRPPILRVVLNGKIVSFDDSDRSLARPHFYAGVMCGGNFGFSAYEGMGGGVAAYLNDIVSLGVGEKISDRGDGAAKHESMLKYVGHVSSIDPTLGMPGAEREIAY